MSMIWRGRPLRLLTNMVFGSLGRNSTGSIVVRGKSRGHRRRFRFIDRFFISSSPSIICRFENFPRSNSVLALVFSSNGFCYYLLAPEGAKIGDYVFPSTYYQSEFSCLGVVPGSYVRLSVVPIGFSLYNLSSDYKRYATFCRSGGCSGYVVSKDDRYALVKLPSGFLKNFCLSSLAQVGTPMVSLHLRPNLSLLKAGRSRFLGRRPRVRGVAMNPVDHPHGGSEGRSSGGRFSSLSPWSRITKGKKTVYNKNVIGTKKGGGSLLTNDYKRDFELSSDRKVFLNKVK